MSKRKIILFVVLLFFVITHPAINKLIVNTFESKPYSNNTLEIIKDRRHLINYYSNKYNISRIALSGSLADEINRSIFLGGYIDRFQNSLMSTTIISNDFLDWAFESGISGKYFNVSTYDVGLGNIKIKTAFGIYQKYKDEFPQINNKKELVNYLLTDAGTIKIAALIIKEAQSLFENHLADCLPETKDAILISYYKQGNGYWLRYLRDSKFNRPPIPGEGKKIIGYSDIFASLLNS